MLNYHLIQTYLVFQLKASYESVSMVIKGFIPLNKLPAE